MKNDVELPFVSICTPTFNRRPFIPFLIKCFEHQTYPRERMEWIIIDDGVDNVEELFKNISEVKYFRYEKKMRLGKKRNLMHSKCIGDIIIYMDDDDYYPPDRVSHAVDKLLKTPSALWAGSSLMYIYFKNINQMYTFGPYGENHATAATFAFKKEMLSKTSYDEDAALAEEKAFLKGGTIPGIQLDPLKTILVFSHIHNTFNKQELLEQPPSKYRNISSVRVEDFIKSEELRKFYVKDIDEILGNYDFGRLEYKPDVIKQKQELEENRRRKRDIEIVKMETKQLMENIFNKQIQEYKKIVNELQTKNNTLEEKNNLLENKIKELINQIIELKKK